MAVQMEYEVTKPGEDEPEPIFEYPPEEDQDEALYVLLFLTALSTLYKKYDGQPSSYILKNIDQDTKILLSDFETHTERLDDLFSTQSGKTLLDAGILPGNLSKVDLPVTSAGDVILEQQATMRGIVDELRNTLKSKARYLESRGAKELFNVKGNFRQATKRVTRTTQNGFRLTGQKAKRAAQVYLYKDPLAYWVTMHDGRVCPYCLAVERDSPMPLSKLPYPPLHLRCRCEVKLEKELDLTEEALKLTLYQYER